MERKLRYRLTQTQQDPCRALDAGWVQDPAFVRAFFDLCDHLAFVLSPATFELALRAVELAEAGGDRHLVHRSQGVLSHAYIVRGDLYWAGRTLEQVRPSALACCPDCRSDFFQRQGFLLGEHFDARESLEALDRALEEGGRRLGADARARIYYCRSYAHHFLGRRRRAIEDVRRCLAGLSLDSPRGYFLDCGAILPIYVIGGDPEHDDLAFAILRDFAERIKGLRGWAGMHTRSAWAGAQLSARQGDYRRSRQLFKRAWIQLRHDGLAREYVAATLDRCQLICRGVEPRGDSPELALELIETCRRRPDLDGPLSERLDAMKNVLEVRPEDAFRELVDCRRSFIAPVPGAMAERIGAG